MKNRVKDEGGFSYAELAVILVVFLVLVVVVIMQVSGVFGGGRAAAMETDVSTMETAVSQFVLKANRVPTENGSLPAAGEYGLIDFSTSFTDKGKTYTFYPDCVKKLPKHHDEGVWRIDSSGVVSVDMVPEDY